MNDYFFLTETNVFELIGKRVEFRAPSASENRPYHGVSIINSVYMSKRNPIECTFIEGDDLKFAFLDDHGLESTDGGETYHAAEANRCFSYSDGYREVSVRICG